MVAAYTDYEQAKPARTKISQIFMYGVQKGLVGSDWTDTDKPVQTTLTGLPVRTMLTGWPTVRIA